MTALWIVGALLLLLLAVLCSRVGVQAAFGEETRVVARLGLIRVQLLPQKEKKKPKKEKPRKEKKKKQAAEKEPWKPTFSAVWQSLPELWRIVKKALAMTFRRVRIDPLRINAVIGGDDPADTAMLYGKVSAAMLSVMPLLQELTNMPDPQIHLEPELQGGESKISGEVGISFLIWDLTVMGFACGVPLVKWLTKLRKQPTNASVKDNISRIGKDEQHGKQAEDQPQRNDGDLHEQGAGDGQQ